MIDVNKLTELSFEGIETEDYPDFCNAFLSEAFYVDRYLTSCEIDYLNDNENTFINEKIHEYIT